MLLSDLFSNGGSTEGIPVESNSVYFKKRNYGVFGSSIRRRQQQPSSLSSLVLLPPQEDNSDVYESTQQQSHQNIVENSNAFVSQVLNKKSNSIEQLKRTVQQSLSILSQPKSVLFGSRKSSQSSVHPLHKSHTHFSQSSSSQLNQQQCQTTQQSLSKSQQQQGINNNNNNNPLTKRPQSNCSVLDSASKIIQSRKIGSADWLGLNERITQELASKNPQHYSYQPTPPRATSPQTVSASNVITVGQDHQYFQQQLQQQQQHHRPPSQPTRFTQSRSNLSSSSLKERVQKLNNHLYTQIVSSNSISAAAATLTPFETEAGSVAYLRQFSSCQDLKKPSTAGATITANKFYVKQPRGSTPEIMSSLCMAQTKTIRGGKVKKADQLKFQNYYESISERTKEFKGSFGLGSHSDAASNAIDLNKIKYQPANPRQTQVNGSSVVEIRQMYLKNKMNETQMEFFNRIIAEGQQSKPPPVIGSEEHKAQLKIDKFAREYKQKTFFVVNNNFGKSDQENQGRNGSQKISKDEVENEESHEKSKKIKKRNDEEVRQTNIIPSEFKNNTLTAMKQNNYDNSENLSDKPAILKFKRVRKQICEFLRKHFLLGLTIEEAKKEGVFLREPFKREGAHVFFRFLKSNDIEMVENMIEKDKYLVFDFDHTLQSPLHWAAKRGQLEIAQILLKNRADVDCADGLGRTPLYFAYRHGHNQMGKLLLLNKASPWSTKRNPIDAMVHSRITNDMTTIKIAQQIHLTMKMVKLQNHAKIWEESKHLFEDKKLIKSKKK